MTKTPAAIRFLLAVAAFILRGIRGLSKRWGAPGSGPFFAGCCLSTRVRLTHELPCYIAANAPR